MEFPDNVATNVHRIDGVSGIRWSRYSIASFAVSHSEGGEKNRSPLSESTDTVEDDGIRTLQSIENRLRLANQHVVLGEGEPILWLFDLAETHETVTSSIFMKSLGSQMVEEYDLTELSSGLIQASELRSNSNSYVPIPKLTVTSNRIPQSMVESNQTYAKTLEEHAALVKAAPTTPLDMPPANELQASQRSVSISLVYPRFLEAISKSLLSRMAKTGKWLPLGTSSFVGPLTSVNHDSGTVEYEVLHKPLLYSLHIELLPSGSLVIAGSPDLRYQMCRICDMIESEPTRFGATIGNDIILAPSGGICSFDREMRVKASIDISTPPAQHDELSKNPVLEKVKRPDKRASVIHHLIQQGIKVPRGDRWIPLRAERYVNQSGHDIGISNTVKSEYETIMWPASLCFIRDDKLVVEDVDVACLRKLSEETSLDPLAYVEAWKKARPAREEATKAALERRKKEEELEARLVEEARYLDEQDSRFESNRRVNQYLSTQDASRIYPTPPDGLRSDPLGSSDNHEHQVTHAAPDDSGTLNSGDDEVAKGETRLSASPSFVSSTRYNQATDDDLFGEIDTGLFATSGLTDADFSFFDEPSEDDGNDRDTCSDVGKSKPTDEMNQETLLTAVACSFDSSPRAAADDLLNKPDRFPDLLGVGTRVGSCQLGLELVDASQSPVNLSKVSHLSIPEDAKHENEWSPVQTVDATSDSSRQVSNYVQEDCGQQRECQRSNFGSVPFKYKLENLDSKYVDQGRFGFETLDAYSISQVRKPSITEEMEFPRLRLHQDRDYAGPLRAKERAPGLPECWLLQDHQALGTSSSGLDDTDEEELSEASIFFKHSPASDNLEIATEPGILDSRKRKREQGMNHGQPTTSSLSTSLEESLSNKHEHTPSTSDSGLDVFSSTSINPLIYKSDLLKYAGNDESFIQVAQILADQIILEPANLFRPFTTTMIRYQPIENLARNGIDDPLAQIVPCIFPKHENCNLKDYTALGGVYSDSHFQRGSTLQQGSKRPIITQSTRVLKASQKNVFKLEAPYTCVRRGGKSVEVCSSALNFWEELGLAPAYGTKEITAFCVFPAQDYIKDGVESFLSMMGSAYHTCKLGSHIQGSLLPEYHKGLVPVTVSGHEVYDTLEEIRRACEKLGRRLSQNENKVGNVVIYMINPLHNRRALPWLCAAFLKIYTSYTRSSKLNLVNDLVLQIVPLDFIASLEGITLPPARAYSRLALEVYDRCGPNVIGGRRQSSQFHSASATRLARSVPKRINFELTPEPSTELLHSDRCFHLSYSWSIKQDWLTASWTDSQGALQWNAAYCLGEEPEPWQAFVAIVREIWETTLEILKPGSSQWRVFVVKDSPMHSKELRAWQSLCSDLRHPSVSITLLTVESNPLLHFPKSENFDKNLTTSSNPCTTPVSTPLNSTFSPDQSGFVSTPGPPSAQVNAPTPTSSVTDHTVEAKLIDITDETWGVTVSRGLPGSNVTTEFCHALISGYLIKRAGARDEDGLIAFGVNIVHAEKPDKALLKDVFGMYRGLGTLARVRGVVDPVSSVLPWHVTAARKAHAIVSSTMRWAGE